MRIYRLLTILFSLTLLFQNVLAQKPKPKPSVGEKEELEKAIATENPYEKIELLKKFLEKFPNSKNKALVQETIAITRLNLAEEKLKNGTTEESIQYFKAAITELPDVITDDFFTKNLLKIPSLLFFNGQQAAAIEIARLIEERILKNTKQLIALATFYLSIEDGESAKRLAEEAIQVDDKFLPAYQTLGLANRLNFDLEASMKAYEKALEIEPKSISIKQNLADTKRALGQVEDALKIYQEILQVEPESIPAKTGLVLSLFELGKINEAEAELEKAKETRNFILLTGAAYWYARESLKNNEYADKAILRAQQAIEIEPRYVWAYIALARAFLVQNKPNEAEKVLLTARQYGNFPTLDYELAASRFASGFYTEAAETLQRNFFYADEGFIETNLGNRIKKRATDFSELLSFELRAGIFQSKRADSKEETQKLKTLFLLTEKLREKEPNEADVIKLVEEFTQGDDKTKAYRLIFAAERLMEKKIALSKALELVKEAKSLIEKSLDIPSASSFVLSDQLYESRRIAISRDQLIVVPQIPRLTLSNIMRGKVEEITGWIFYQQSNLSEAIVHLRRAVSILPENSAWWRSSWWRLGACYEAKQELSKALDAYVKSYKSGESDSLKLKVIENLYRRIYGNLDGLENLLQAKTEIKNDLLAKQIEQTEQLKNQSKQTDASQSQTSINAENKDNLPNEKQAESDNSKTQIKSEEKLLEKKVTEESKVEISKTEEPKISDIKSDKLNISEPDLSKISETELNTLKTDESKIDESKADDSKVKELNPAESKSDGFKNTESKSEQKNTEINQSETEIKEASNSAISKATENTTRNKTASEEKENEKKSDTKPDNAKRIEVIVEDRIVENKEKKDELTQVGQVRPRIVKTETFQQRQDCSLTISQEEISIIRNSGRLGILVGYSSGVDEDLNKIIAIPDSPRDIQVEYETEIAKTSKQLFLVIKSVSENTGTFGVFIKSPCGNKKVTVKVR